MRTPWRGPATTARDWTTTDWQAISHSAWRNGAGIIIIIIMPYILVKNLFGGADKTHFIVQNKVNIKIRNYAAAKNITNSSIYTI